MGTGGPVSLARRLRVPGRCIDLRRKAPGPPGAGPVQRRRCRADGLHIPLRDDRAKLIAIRFRANRRHGAAARFRRDAQRHTHHVVTQRVPRWCVASRRCWQSSPVSADRGNESCGAASRSKPCGRDESGGSRSPESCEVAAESRKTHRRAHSEAAQAHDASAPRCRQGAARVSGPRQQSPFSPARKCRRLAGATSPAPNVMRLSPVSELLARCMHR